MKVEDIKKFIEFRRKFTKREWFEINKAVSDQENKRADQLILDDSDVNEILARINRHSDNSININIKEKKLSSEDKNLISKTIEDAIRSKKNQYEEQIGDLYFELIRRISKFPDDIPESVASTIIGLNNVLNYIIAKQKLYEKIPEWNN